MIRAWLGRLTPRFESAVREVVVRFLLLFLFLLFGLSFISNYPSVRIVAVEPWNDWLAAGSYWLMQWFDQGAAYHGNIIYPRSGGGGVAIESG